MKQTLGLLLVLLLTVGSAWAQPLVELKTSLGSMRIELDAEQAPQTVKNFLAYVDSNFYDGTIFHRVIDGFMIQGGGFSSTLQRRETRAPIANEADNGLQNRRGTIAMARSRTIDSATSQFFINLVDNDFLNHRGPTPQAFGYAVFGRVVAGMEVVDQIGRQKTLVKSPVLKDFPEQQIIIESVRRVDQD